MPVHFGFGRGMPRIVKTLLIVNIGIFLFTALMGRTWQNVFFRVFGLVPVLVNHRFMVWQFFTYMFLHGSVGHILINMFMLWMFGSELEYNWGSRDFLKYYLTCGIGGGLLVWFTSFLGLSSSIATTIGASGAIFGLLVAYGMMWPDRLIYIYGIFPMKALHLVLLFGAINLFYGFSGTGGSIAYFAHIGGGVTGFLYLKYGWRIMIPLESYLKRIKRRRFKIIQGGDVRHRQYDDDETIHPDLDEEVDRILDKIAREGMDSLNDNERRILERASSKRKR